MKSIMLFSIQLLPLNWFTELLHVTYEAHFCVCLRQIYFIYHHWGLDLKLHSMLWWWHFHFMASSDFMPLHALLSPQTSYHRLHFIKLPTSTIYIISVYFSIAADLITFHIVATSIADFILLQHMSQTTFHLLGPVKIQLKLLLRTQFMCWFFICLKYHCACVEDFISSWCLQLRFIPNGTYITRWFM